MPVSTDNSLTVSVARTLSVAVRQKCLELVFMISPFKVTALGFVKIGVGVTVGVALGADYFKSLSHTTTNVVVSDDFLLVGSSQISPVMMNSSPSTAFEGTSAW